MVEKLEMGLMALFEPIVLASASFLIHFYRALTFKRPIFPGFWSNSCKTRKPP